MKRNRPGQAALKTTTAGTASQHIKAAVCQNTIRRATGERQRAANSCVTSAQCSQGIVANEKISNMTRARTLAGGSDVASATVLRSDKHAYEPGKILSAPRCVHSPQTRPEICIALPMRPEDLDASGNATIGMKTRRVLPGITSSAIVSGKRKRQKTRSWFASRGDTTLY